MIVLFVIACIVLFIIEPCNPAFGLSRDQIFGMFSYHFMHVNVLHLIMNMLSLAIIYKPIHHLYIRKLGHFTTPPFFIAIYVLATIAGAAAALHTPTYGASGIVFVLLGMLLALNPTKQQIKNYIYVGIAVVISIFTGKSNVLLHILAFALGGIYILCLKWHDARRTAKNR